MARRRRKPEPWVEIINSSLRDLNRMWIEHMIETYNAESKRRKELKEKKGK